MHSDDLLHSFIDRASITIYNYLVIYTCHNDNFAWYSDKIIRNNEDLATARLKRSICNRSGLAQICSSSSIFQPVWPSNLMDDLGNFLGHIKLFVSFQIHPWIQTEVTVRKPSIQVKIDNFLSRVTLKFDGWPWKTIGHLFYIASSYVHHFITISKFKLGLQSGNTLFYTLSSCVHHFKTMLEFKLELQSGNAKLGSKSAIFCPVWPWNLMDDLRKQWSTSSILHQDLCIISKPWLNSNLSYSPETLNSGQDRHFFVPYDLEIWRMTLKNNRAPLLYCFKLCASFHNHQ